MEGTYPLPEAQLDRFFFKLNLASPDLEELSQIMDLTTGESAPAVEPVCGPESVEEISAMARRVKIAEEVKRYALRLVTASHPASTEAPDAVRQYVKYGASPRAAQSMILAGKVRALSAGRYNVAYDDLSSVVLPVAASPADSQLRRRAGGGHRRRHRGAIVGARADVAAAPAARSMRRNIVTETRERSTRCECWNASGDRLQVPNGRRPARTATGNRARLRRRVRRLPRSTAPETTSATSIGTSTRGRGSCCRSSTGPKPSSISTCYSIPAARWRSAPPTRWSTPRFW